MEFCEGGRHIGHLGEKMEVFECGRQVATLANLAAKRDGANSVHICDLKLVNCKRVSLSVER